MHIVFRHRFWSTLRINQSCALNEYDSLNSCTVGTIFCLLILLRKRVTAAVFAGTLSTFILNCIGLFSESGCRWDIPAIYFDSRMRVSMPLSDKWIKTIAWPNGEQKAIRTAYASCIILRFVLEWHKSDTACAYLIQASWNKRHSAGRVHSNSARRNNERERATLSCISSAVYIGRAWPNASIVIRCVAGAWYCMNFSIALVSVSTAISFALRREYREEKIRLTDDILRMWKRATKGISHGDSRPIWNSWIWAKFPLPPSLSLSLV